MIGAPSPTTTKPATPLTSAGWAKCSRAARSGSRASKPPRRHADGRRRDPRRRCPRAARRRGAGGRPGRRSARRGRPQGRRRRPRVDAAGRDPGPAQTRERGGGPGSQAGVRRSGVRPTIVAISPNGDREHVVQHEGEPLGGRQRLEHDQERQADRVGEHRLRARGRAPRSARPPAPAAAPPRTDRRAAPAGHAACRGRSVPSRWSASRPGSRYHPSRHDRSAARLPARHRRHRWSPPAFDTTPPTGDPGAASNSPARYSSRCMSHLRVAVRHGDDERNATNVTGLIGSCRPGGGRSARRGARLQARGVPSDVARGVGPLVDPA